MPFQKYTVFEWDLDENIDSWILQISELQHEGISTINTFLAFPQYGDHRTIFSSRNVFEASIYIFGPRINYDVFIYTKNLNQLFSFLRFLVILLTEL